MVEDKFDEHAAEPAADKNSPATWEREMLEKLVLASVTEQRRARRWGIFFKSLFMVYLIVALWLVAEPFDDFARSGSSKHTAVIDVTGMIADGAETTADNIIEGLRVALEDHGTKGIILHMNTPGGSPVQSAYIYEEIRRIKREKPEMPIHAVVSDLCASGGYYIAAAADKIFVNSASVVGSIGVIMNGFGFVDAIGKLGVERRLLTAGEHKAILDPFKPISAMEKEHIQGLINNIHRQFIEAVKQGRGQRLKDDPALFSGLVWTGEEGIKLGLVDEMGDVRSVAKSVIGAEELVNFTPRERLLDRLSHRIGTAFGHALQTAVGLTPSLR
jgi:protease-4